MRGLRACVRAFIAAAVIAAATIAAAAIAAAAIAAAAIAAATIAAVALSPLPSTLYPLSRADGLSSYWDLWCACVGGFFVSLICNEHMDQLHVGSAR